ncbi:TRAP transporter small permease subunit [Echinimonas agarilytica]|nr:TRAP transporter small permease subunit [Echinimonas agarilytica]
MMVIVAVVALRYGFNIGLIALQDSALFVHGLIFMGGAAYTLQRDKHVRVDVFYRAFSERRKALINLVGHLIFLFPVVLFIAISSETFIAMSWKMAEASPESGGLPGFFILKSYLWLFCFLMGLQGISECVRNLRILRQKEASNDG